MPKGPSQKQSKNVSIAALTSSSVNFWFYTYRTSNNVTKLIIEIPPPPLSTLKL